MPVYSRFMEEDEETTQDGEISEPQEAEYVFEGFKVDFSEKIALTPPETTVKAQAA
jgi:hypothetical protein